MVALDRGDVVRGDETSKNVVRRTGPPLFSADEVAFELLASPVRCQMNDLWLMPCFEPWPSLVGHLRDSDGIIGELVSFIST